MVTVSGEPGSRSEQRPRASSSTMCMYVRPYCQALLAEGLLLASRGDEARAVIAEGVEESRQTGQTFAVSELHRLEGESWVAAGEPGRAEACFQRAMAVARSQGAPAFEQKAAASLARRSL